MHGILLPRELEHDRGRVQRTLPSGWQAVGKPNGHCPLSDNGLWAGGGKVYTYPPKARIAESQHVTLLYALVTLALLNPASEVTGRYMAGIGTFEPRTGLQQRICRAGPAPKLTRFG